ncbi:hypothetical protein [Bacillus sp. NEB1478]|uniref:hypothetical protein n=1 Tax=Bacillus sp. NEB1478 TaxID=3073816 RepID=UPI0028739B49|nr:hypothetical protein [Bacillus sp. NEB1478]WNB92549.1 hypothetical protein RGB74_02460 [Bacillus sp. NEB1478]
MYKFYLKRKLFASFLSSFLSSFIIAVLLLWAQVESVHDLTKLIKSIFQAIFFYNLVIGIIVLTYGNIVSSTLEFIYKSQDYKGKVSNVLYVIIHVFFGALFGALLEGDIGTALICGLPALIFGITDLWLIMDGKQE